MQKQTDKKTSFKDELQLSINDILKQLQGITSDAHKPFADQDNLPSVDSLDRINARASRLEDQRKDAAKARAAEKESRNKAIEEEIHDFNVTVMDLPLDFENEYEGDSRAEINAESVSDGLLYSLNNLGKVDIEYISQISSRPIPDVIRELKGVIYQNPATWNECFYKGWETASEYFSGNLINKYHDAVEANKKYNNHFADNEKMLLKMLPLPVEKDDIYITLGSPWVPSDILDDFIRFLSGLTYSERYFGESSRVRHDELTGTWEIPRKTRFRHTRAFVQDSVTYGTNDMGMLYLLEATLNMRTVKISDKVSEVDEDDNPVDRWVVNEKKTMLANEKQQLLISTFQDWVWKDKKRKDRLLKIYDEKYVGLRRRRFDGSYLLFPGMNKDVQLYPYQKDAVARIILSPNTLLAHDVGSGKTYIMIAAAMEMRRIGKSRRNLFVVPNNLTGQWKDIFLEMYPDANVLVVDPKNFTASKRNDTLNRIILEDFDGIIMAYSCFDMLPLSEQYYERLHDERVEALNKVRKAFYSGATIDRKIKVLDRALEKIKKSLEGSKYIYRFDELGFNTIFLDEAHNYKNVPIGTHIEGIRGISNTGSEKCKGMMDKVLCIQRQNGGRGAVFATGTPITNSVTDIFVMQQYLQSGELAMLGLNTYDSWVGMFAEKVTNYEIDIDTNSYHLVTRFSKFHNLPELTTILSSIADFHHVGNEANLPDFNGYTDTQLNGTGDFKDFLQEISKRADDVRKKRVKRKEDNLLKITTDGRKAALDMRLINDKLDPSNGIKVQSCAKNIYELYRETDQTKGAQIVFCDTSVPKSSFNLYTELKRLLVSMGMPGDNIAFIHDADSEEKRESLFDKVNKGEIRVIMGSTFKLGLGVNVQERLVAAHHLDVPWRPADMIQREGRILRQGNLCKEVKIFRYITKGSFDAYSWQLLETKQRFISQLLSGTVSDRNGDDVDDVILNYAEVKALAVGNSKIKERCEVANELSKKQLLQKSYVETRSRMSTELDTIPDRIILAKRDIAKMEADKAYFEEHKKEYSKDELRDIRQKIFFAVNHYLQRPAESLVTEYQGFEILVPKFANLAEYKIIVRGESTYYLLIENEKGIITRLNNFFESFDAKINLQKDTIEGLKEKMQTYKEELSKESGYLDEIRKLTDKLNTLDKELGLKKNDAS